MYKDLISGVKRGPFCPKEGVKGVRLNYRETYVDFKK